MAKCWKQTVQNEDKFEIRCHRRIKFVYVESNTLYFRITTTTTAATNIIKSLNN